jgi:ankyrin repeat protein
LLIDEGTDPCVPVGDRNTTLHLAASAGLLSICQRLIEDFHCEPDVTNSFGETPVMLAAENNRLPVVEHLVEKYNVDLEKRGKRNKRPIDYAHEAHSLDCYNYLSHTVLSDLMRAARTGNLDQINELLKVETIQSNINQQNDANGFTALHYAIKSGHTQVVERLLDFHCIDQLKAESNEGTALQLAICLPSDLPYLPILNLLIQKGNADVNTVLPEHGFQIIHFACATGKLDAVQHLIENYHVDPNGTGGQHQDTPLMVAAQMAQIQIVNYLLSLSNVNTSVQNIDGKTALDYAQESQCPECIDALNENRENLF